MTYIWHHMHETFVIYGAYGGIGSAVARKLHERNVPLHLVGRDDERTRRLAGELDAEFTVGDVTGSAVFSQVADAVGDTCAGLVYAVGTIDLRSLSRFSETDFAHDFRVNAMGAALAVQALLPALKKGSSASVLFFSSVAAQQGFAFHASIGMAKGAVEGLTLSLAAELAPKIRVNAIAPSLIQTPLAQKLISNEKMAESIAGLHAMQRLGTPEDIARLAAFLLTEESDWITGQIYCVDGGRSSLRTKG